MSVIPPSFANSTTACYAPPAAYGSFSSTQTQAVAAGVPLPLIYDTVDLPPVGVSCAVPSADIVIGVAGVYKVLASLQCDRTAALTGDLEMYVAINGTGVPNSTTRVNINQNIESVMAVEWFLPLDKGDDVTVVIASAVAGNQAAAFVAAPPIPAIPSIITTVLRIA
jgi:hypothetical protein